MTAHEESMLERIQRFAEEAKARAVPAARPLPVPVDEAPPPAHWAERGDDAREASGAPARSLAGENMARRGAAARLRSLLADGAWHSALELVDVGGMRYGARLHEIRRGEDGGPSLVIEGQARAQGSRQVWFYRSPRSSAAEAARNFDLFGAGGCSG